MNEKTLTLTFVTFAIAAMVVAMATTGIVKVVQAAPPNGGVPFGQTIKGEAQSGKNSNDPNNKNGFGDEIKEQIHDQGGKVGDFRASDEAGKSPGKGGPPTRDENAGNPDN